MLKLIQVNELTENTEINEFETFDDVNTFLENIGNDESNPPYRSFDGL
jgi:hypothetical protein